MCLLRGTDWVFIYNSTFCPHSVFMCFVWTSEQTAIISLYSINWLVFITETECVYCAVRIESLPQSPVPTGVGGWLALPRDSKRCTQKKTLLSLPETDTRSVDCPIDRSVTLPIMQWRFPVCTSFFPHLCLANDFMMTHVFLFLLRTWNSKISALSSSRTETVQYYL